MFNVSNVINRLIYLDKLPFKFSARVELQSQPCGLPFFKRDQDNHKGSIYFSNTQ